MLPAFDADDPRARTQHLLALPSNVASDEVEVLAVSRFGRVSWDEPDAPPRTGLIPAVTSALGIRTVAPDAPRLRLGRLSALTGPYALARSDAVALGLPPSSDTLWVVDAPRERGEQPFAFGGDRDGLRRAFPDAAPVREEDRVLRWLVAAARRLGGAVRTAEHGVVLVPDPDAAVDLTVFTPADPQPDDVLARVRAVLPRAVPIGPDPGAWAGPPVPRHRGGRHARVQVSAPDPGTAELALVLQRHGVDDEAERRALEAEARAYDEMTAGAVRPGVFGVQADLGLDGTLEVLVEPLDVPPAVLREAPWAHDLHALRVRWLSGDDEQMQAERPNALHRVARGRAAPLVASVAVHLWDAYDGEVADEAEFLVHPDDLR